MTGHDPRRRNTDNISGRVLGPFNGRLGGNTGLTTEILYTLAGILER